MYLCEQSSISGHPHPGSDREATAYEWPIGHPYPHAIAHHSPYATFDFSTVDTDIHTDTYIYSNVNAYLDLHPNANVDPHVHMDTYSIFSFASCPASIGYAHSYTISFPNSWRNA